MKNTKELINGYDNAKDNLYTRLFYIFPYLSLEHVDEYSKLYNKIVESNFDIMDIFTILEYYINDTCYLFGLNRDNITNITYYDTKIVGDFLHFILKFDTIVNKENISLEVDVHVADSRKNDYAYINLHNKSNDLKCTLDRYEADKYKCRGYNIVDIINDKNICKILSDALNYFNKVDDFIKNNIKLDNIDVIVNDSNRLNIATSISNILDISDRDSIGRVIEYSYNTLANIVDSRFLKKKAECTNILFIRKGLSYDGMHIRFKITFKVDGNSYDILTDYYLYDNEFSSKLL